MIPFETMALATALFFSLSSIMTRRGLDGSTPHTGSFVVLQTQFAFFVLALLLAVDFSGLSFSWYWFAFFAAGISSPALSLMFLFRSIQNIGVAPTSSISNTHAIFGALWAVLLLGERPPVWVWLGIVLVVCGVYLISGGGAITRGRYVYLPLLSAMFFGMAHMLRKVGLAGVQSLILGGFLQGATASLIGPLFLKAGAGWRPFVFAKRSVGYFVLAGFCMASGQFTLLYALEWGPVSRVSPLVSTVPLFTLVLTPVLLGGKERITRRIIFGACFIVAGVALVTALR